MERLYRRLKGSEFAMLAVAEDDGGAAAVVPFVRDHNLTFTILLDPEATLSSRYGATGYPETFVIDRAGRVVHHVVGPADWDNPEAIAYFEQLLTAPEVQSAGNR